jgi:hypothetical protein
LKGKGRIFRTSDSDEDDTLGGFIVPDGSDDDFKPKLKKRLKKRRANVVMDSDDDDDYEDVVIKAKRDTQVPSGKATMMKEDQLSTKMAVSPRSILDHSDLTSFQHLMGLLKNWRKENPDDKVGYFADEVIVVRLIFSRL